MNRPSTSADKNPALCIALDMSDDEIDVGNFHSIAKQKTSKMGAPQTSIGNRLQRPNIKNIMNRPSTSADKTQELYMDSELSDDEYQVDDRHSISDQKTSKMASKTSIGDRLQNQNTDDIMNKPSTSAVKTMELCNDFEQNDEEYQVGDIVWAKIGKYPFWPSMVCDDPVSEIFIKRSPKDKKKFSLHVRFFNDNCRRNWVKNVEKYSGKDDFLSKHPNCFAGLKMSEKQKENWNYAVDEAVIWFKFKNLEARWIQFSYAYKIRNLPPTPPKPSSSVNSSIKSTDGSITMAKQRNTAKRALEDFPKASIIDVKTNEKLNIVEGQEFLIGSSLNCSLMVEDIHISSIQCIIKYENNRFVIYDHSTTSNTFVNGIRLHDKDGFRVLKHGDVVTIENEGKMSYIYRFVLVTKSKKKFKPKENKGLIKNLLLENKQLKTENGQLKSEQGLMKREIDKLNLTGINLTIDHEMFQRRVQDTLKVYRKKFNDLTSLLEKHVKSVDIKKHCVETLRRQVSRHLEDNFQCSICSETMYKATIGNCTHTFCETCLSTWLRRSRQCPVCRTAIHFTSNCLSIDNFMEDICETLGGALKEQRDSQKRERAVSLPAPVDGQLRVRPRLIVQNRQGQNPNQQVPPSIRIDIEFFQDQDDTDSSVEIVDLTHLQ